VIPHRNTGRISTWAIALGIGAAMTAAGTGVASADPAAPATEPSSVADSAPNSTAAKTTATRPGPPRHGPQPDQPVRQSATPPDRDTIDPPTTSRPAALAAPTRTIAALAAPTRTIAAQRRTARLTNPGRSIDPASGPTGGDPIESPVSWMAAAAASRTSGSPRAAALQATSPPTPQPLNPAGPKAAAAQQPTDPFSAVFSGLAAAFFTQTPTLRPAQSGSSTNGVVNGNLNAADPDSPALRFTITGKPTHGTATVNRDGTFSYLADPSVAATGTTDTFRVTVSDAASGFQLHGIGGLINFLSLGLIGQPGDSSTSTVTVTVSPFNNLPTGYAVFGTPDPTTGVVLGRVVGSDVDADRLTYSGSATTVKGAVIVTAAGNFAYTPTSQALQNATAPTATAADRQDSFDVTIDDGRSGTVAVPVTVQIGQSAPLSTFCGCTLMPADTVFHADVRNLPVLTKSGTWLSVLGADRGATLRATWGGEPWMGSIGGMPVNVVSASQRTERVIFNRGLSTSGPSIDDRPYAIPDYPIVEGMGPAGSGTVPAWDRHLLVFQKGTCISQELYNVANGVELPANGIGDALANGIYANQYGSAWIAEAGVRYDMSDPLYPAIGAANASRLPYLPLILRPDDLERGHIDHMLGITIAKDRGTGYTWPARDGDGTGTNPDGVPMGTVLRLRADFDMTSYSPATQVILRALQEHGAVIYDSGNRGEDGARVLGMSNGWTGTDHITAQRELERVPLTAFEAVDVMSLALDPAAGWMIRSTVI
jgi:VCBS repeat-containing protein